MEKIIQLRGVQKRYGDRIILDKINLDIEKGSMVAIVGESGCGKTTLLNIIGLLDGFETGKMKIKNQIFSPRNHRKKTPILRYTISYLFQNFALIDNKSVSENLDVALRYVKLPKKEKEIIKLDVLQEVGMSGYLNHVVYQLSGGEQQRVALARAMIKPSEILLADEPTGSLDYQNKMIVLEFIKILNQQGKTVIIVTHDENVAKACDRMIYPKDFFTI